MPITDNDVEFYAVMRSGNRAAILTLISKRKKLPTGALYTASQRGQTEIVEILISSGKVSPLQIGEALGVALEQRYGAIISILAAAGPDLQTRIGLGKMPLLVAAAASGSIAAVKGLLSCGANPNDYDVPIGGSLLGKPVGRTALMAAAEKGNSSIVELLLEGGADPWIEGKEGKTAHGLIVGRKGRNEIATVLWQWMQKHPARSAVRPVNARANIGEPFVSWKEAVSRLERIVSAKAGTHPQARKIVRLPLTLEAASSLSQNRPTQKKKTTLTYRAALTAVKKMGAGLNAQWFLQFEPIKGVFLCGLPGADKWKVLGTIKTSCENYGVTHAALAKFLKTLDAENPFDLIECDHESVCGRFTGKLKSPLGVACKVIAFCPFAAEDDGKNVKRFAKSLETAGYFKLWWD